MKDLRGFKAMLGLLEIVGKHTLPRFQPRHITDPRNVQQDTTRDDPVRRSRDGRPPRSRRGGLTAESRRATGTR